LLIEPSDVGSFENYLAVAEGMVRLDLDIGGMRGSGLLEHLKQCFTVRTGAGKESSVQAVR
jgi:hypothetical protein